MKAALSPAWQKKLLQEAADLLGKAAVKGYEMKMRPKLTGRQVDVRIVFTWPGYTRIYEARSGELLAESQPGRPLTPKK